MTRIDKDSKGLEATSILEEFRDAGALLEGHFILSSGLRTPLFIQKMRLFEDPVRTERVCRLLAHKVQMTFGHIDVVVAPALGGIIPAYETARHLQAKAFFVERFQGRFQLRRGFELHPNMRVLVLEDIITTGKSARETITALADYPAEIVGVACFIDRSGGNVPLDVPYVALAAITIPTYLENNIPEDLARLPAVEPGSRRA